MKMKRPLTYYALAVYIACLNLMFLQINIIFAILMTIIFVAVIFFTQNIKGFILILCFFIIGCLSFFIYFNVDIGGSAKFRIIEKSRGSYIGDYRGRKVILYGNLSNIELGEKIVVKGNFSDDKDYSKGVIGKYKIKSCSKGRTDFLKKVYDFKEKLYYKYSKVLGDKNAGVIMAACYGDTKYLNFQIKEEINKLGISHIISVSGFHLAIVYKLLEKVLGIKLGLVGSFLYMIFTGAEAATIRSYVMILILKLSKVFYKNYDGLSSLSLSAIIIFIIKPYYVLDIGCTLSFLATLGIIIYNGKIQRALYMLPKELNENLSVTLSAQIFAMPYTMCTIENISMFFIPGNLMLAPLYSFVVLLGTLGIIFVKFDMLFRIITSLLYSTMISIEGGTYLLLKIAPSLSEYNYFYGIVMLAMFMSYVFIKHGYKELMYFPAALMCFIIMYNMV
ncbi:ComEC family competence protein [Clostridium thermopalmarium DSM 5974]|uniref:ComEC family competence protein n=3 Tax=Clostridiaceae TaxID=31979 RepID=A0A151ALR3_9CLOT|nr:ComEC family competence protein [Clostridium colicanis DSM 13634]PRR74151.1 ComEC family competence protein [Clostridium thermopalmarium DSM 5974]PVZ25479.1 competence protein ComEC [Clostridium thermopalmarium DSM 5974]